MQEQESLAKTNIETFSCLNKESFISKNNKNVKILTSDLSPYIHEEFGFIDPDFPHVLSSITGTETDSQQNFNIEWLPAEDICKKVNYSNQISCIEANLFKKQSITHALTLINWFAGDQCPDLFSRELSEHHLYQFDIMLDGIFIKMSIDSYIPISSQNKQEIFSKNKNGSIFPCLYEKLLAKVYGDYNSITSEFVDIVEMQSFFCRQEISVSLGIVLPELQKIIMKKIEQKSIVGFRTRNSIRLESFGLLSNHVYIILRIIEREEGNIVEFLQLDGEKWIGRMSKLRSTWVIEQPAFIEEKKILLSKQFKQNYMSLSDMKGLTRELVVLNNTSEYHKNYHQCTNNPNNLTMYRFTLEQKNNIMLRTSYKHKRCYNSILVIKNITQSNKNIEGNQFRLIQSSFHENKDGNFMELRLEKGMYFIIVYNSHPQEQNLCYNLTFFSSDQYIQLVPFFLKSDILHVLQSTFKYRFSNKYLEEGQQIVLKHLYGQTGLAFIYVRPGKSAIQFKINSKLFQDWKIFAINEPRMNVEDQCIKSFKKQTEDIIIFRCLWSRKENIAFDYDNKKQVEKIVFPPVGSISAIQKKSS